jgi:hypothetical protein
MNVKRLTGYVVWIVEPGADEECEVQQAILRENGNELVIDCECPSEGVYTFTLRRKDALNFDGGWKLKLKGESGECKCRVYSNGENIACIGSWQQGTGSQTWFAELHSA